MQDQDAAKKACQKLNRHLFKVLILLHEKSPYCIYLLNIEHERFFWNLF